MKEEIRSMLDSTAHSRELAMVMSRSSNGFELGIDDAAQCVKALSFHASRWRRRAGVALAFTLVAALGAGLPDLNGDGRASLADLGFAAKAMVGSVTLGSTARAMERKS